jgi:hypothetical protein
MKRLAYLLVVAGLVAGCAQPLSTREKGALIGAGVGAGAGAVVGNQIGHTGVGALVGAGVGAVSGAVIGDAIQSKEQQHRQAPVVAALPASAIPPPLPAAPPQLVWVPAWGVHIVHGYDVVLYNNAFYYFHGERWWLSQASTGPWVAVASAPPAIAQLPRGRLHAHLPPGHGPRHCPPGQAKKGRC